MATLPFGVLADRVTRTRILGGTILLWGVAMLWSATASDFTELLWTRLFLGAVTASAGPMVASLVGDWFGSWERGRIYGVILAGEYVGACVGFAVTGNVSTLSWRASFVLLALPAFALALAVWRLPEPKRGGLGVLFGPSVGFLLGWAPAAFVSGLVMARLKTLPVGLWGVLRYRTRVRGVILFSTCRGSRL